MQAVVQITDDMDDIQHARQLDQGLITQDGIARVFAKRYAGRLRYCHHAGRWYQWTGTYWRPDDLDVAFEFVRVLGREITETRDAKDVKEVRKVSFANGVERFTRSDPTFAVTASCWDKDTFQLGTPGGTVELRTGKLRPSVPDEGITKTTAIAPAATSDCPVWKRFLAEACAQDFELIRFLQQWAGYSLTGDVREHALVFGYGPGGNGKSVFLNTVAGVMADYAVTAPADTFTASLHDRHPTDLAMLRGARLVAASETEQNRAWAESRIKQLTGGDPVTARFMRRDFFTFQPEFKLFVVGNHQPSLVNVDDAARRRINIVPFVTKPARPDLQLEQKLRQEWPAILQWMIEGCLDWQKNGLIRPSCVMAATSEYFDDQDTFDQWLGDECEVKIGNERIREASASLFRSWTRYAQAAGEKPGSKKAFGSTLKKRFPPFREGKLRGFKGLRLLEPQEQDVTHDAF